MKSLVFLCKCNRMAGGRRWLAPGLCEIYRSNYYSADSDLELEHGAPHILLQHELVRGDPWPGAALGVDTLK